MPAAVTQKQKRHKILYGGLPKVFVYADGNRENGLRGDKMFNFNMKNCRRKNCGVRSCFGKKGGVGFWRRCHVKLCANAWWLFAWAALALFCYLLFNPCVFLMFVLLLIVCGLIFWLRA